MVVLKEVDVLESVMLVDTDTVADDNLEALTERVLDVEDNLEKPVERGSIAAEDIVVSGGLRLELEVIGVFIPLKERV